MTRRKDWTKPYQVGEILDESICKHCNIIIQQIAGPQPQLVANWYHIGLLPLRLCASKQNYAEPMNLDLMRDRIINVLLGEKEIEISYQRQMN